MNFNDNKFFNSTDIHVSSRMNEYLKKNFGYAVEGDFETLEEAKKSLQAEQVELRTSQYMSQKYMENMLMIETITSLLKAHGEDTVSSYEQQEVTEEKAEFSDKQIKMAFGILNDPRYKDGNYSGAVATIEKIATGLSKHPSVANALKRANESVEEVVEKKKSKNFYPNFKETLEAIDLDLSQTGETTTSDASPETEQVAEDEEEKGPDHYRWKNDSQLSIAKDKLEQTMTELAIAINYREENSRNLMSNGDKAGTGDLQEMLNTLRKMHYDWEDTTQYYGM
jgi:hypothetical protein